MFSTRHPLRSYVMVQWQLPYCAEYGALDLQACAVMLHTFSRSTGGSAGATSTADLSAGPGGGPAGSGCGGGPANLQGSRTSPYDPQQFIAPAKGRHNKWRLWIACVITRMGPLARCDDLLASMEGAGRDREQLPPCNLAWTPSTRKQGMSREVPALEAYAELCGTAPCTPVHPVQGGWRAQPPLHIPARRSVIVWAPAC